MLKRNFLSCGVVLALVLFLSAGAASASQIVTGSVPTTMFDFNTTFTVSPFNTALGTLTGITVKLDGTTNVYFTATDPSSTDAITFYSSVGGTETVSISTFSLTVAPAQSLGSVGTPINIAALGTYTIFPNPTVVVASNTAAVGSGLWGLFETGSPVTLSFSGSNATVNHHSGAWSESDQVSGSAAVTVTYDYGTGVPEPATLSLMGGALLGLGFLLRRKRS